MDNVKQVFQEELSTDYHVCTIKVVDVEGKGRWLEIKRKPKTGTGPVESIKIPEKYIDEFNVKYRNAYIEVLRKKTPRAWMPWKEEEKLKIQSEFKQSKTIEQIASELQRTPGAVFIQLKLLKLVDEKANYSEFISKKVDDEPF
ncbi:MAG: hypothetical protein A2252_09270 [Elusimicrobia bacterium RIFOXYA2_FULL_39_19]|nr:MAG: hypothetical protein A2252_09270 [Elusimicrobia bacterium RIFOXYA2_FULL_39_19]